MQNTTANDGKARTQKGRSTKYVYGPVPIPTNWFRRRANLQFQECGTSRLPLTTASQKNDTLNTNLIWLNCNSSLGLGPKKRLCECCKVFEWWCDRIVPLQYWQASHTQKKGFTSNMLLANSQQAVHFHPVKIQYISVLHEKWKKSRFFPTFHCCPFGATMWSRISSKASSTSG